MWAMRNWMGSVTDDACRSEANCVSTRSLSSGCTRSVAGSDKTSSGLRPNNDEVAGLA